MYVPSVLYRKISEMSNWVMAIVVIRIENCWPLLFRLDEQLDHVTGGLLQVEGDGLQFQLAGFDLGEVQEVVDNGEQYLPGLADGFQVVALLLIEFAAGQQLYHAQHAVHGCADLVAHSGQEFTLGMGGAFGHTAGPLHFRLGVLAVADVDEGLQQDLLFIQGYVHRRFQYGQFLSTGTQQGILGVVHGLL